MSPCHNLEPSLVARDSSRLLSVKPNEWMHLLPFYTRMHGEWLRYAKSTSQFHWRFLLVRDVRGFQVNPLCCHDITSPFPPSGNGGYVLNLDVKPTIQTLKTIIMEIRDERVQHYLYLYLLTIWIICICICTRTERGLTRKWAGFNLEVGRVVLKWAGL